LWHFIVFDVFNEIDNSALREACRPSVAYINFHSADSIGAFHTRFVDQVLTDKNGNEYRTQIEYAPYQRIPRLKKPKDPRQGKYENGMAR
jgi:hypothetical protein